MYIQYSDVYILRTVDHLHNEISLDGSFRRLVSPDALARSLYDLDVDVAEGCHYIRLAPKLNMKLMDLATVRQERYIPSTELSWAIWTFKRFLLGMLDPMTLQMFFTSITRTAASDWTFIVSIMSRYHSRVVFAINRRH